MRSYRPPHNTVFSSNLVRREIASLPQQALLPLDCDRGTREEYLKIRQHLLLDNPWHHSCHSATEINYLLNKYFICKHSTTATRVPPRKTIFIKWSNWMKALWDNFQVFASKWMYSTSLIIKIQSKIEHSPACICNKVRISYIQTKPARNQNEPICRSLNLLYIKKIYHYFS